MATRGSRRRRVILATAIGLLSVALSSAAADSPFGSELPASRSSDATLTERRCARCHTLQRVVEATHRGAAWSRVVQRMRRKSRSGISSAEAKRIGDFLAWWSDPRRASAGASSAGALEPPRFAEIGAVSLPLGSESVEVTLGDGAWRVDSLAREDGRTTARLTIAGATVDATFETTEDGTIARTFGEARSWSVGPYRFRLVVAISDVDADQVRLGAYVERVPRLSHESPPTSRASSVRLRSTPQR